MADFYGTMKKVQDNVSVTENGMTGYKTTYHPLLDMNFKISSYRHSTDEQIRQDIDKILAEQEDAKYLLKFLFMVRGVREGLGERRLFRVALKHTLFNATFDNKDEIIKDLIKNQIVEFGRYDDLFIFMGTAYQDFVVETLLNQLKQDYTNMEKGKPISLLAKWMPSENTSSAETRKLAKVFIKSFGASAKEYRQTLSKLRAYLKVIETYTSANEWGKIDYNQVPSKANLKYKDAFLKHDEERRRDYLAALRVGVDKEGKEVKINSSVNFPHEIVNKYGIWAVGPYDEALEQLWKNLKQKDGLKNTIVVRDGSGSMTDRIGGTSVTALDVSTALAIYCSERLNDTFKDKFITFSAQAKLVDLSKCASLQAKLKVCRQESDCSNTNIQNVFNLILNTALEGNIKPEDMPEQVLIISDMEFDPARPSGAWGGGFNAGSNVFEVCDKAYKNAGYKLPKIVFWNVNSRTNTIPMKQNENGVVLVSGFSVNTLNMVLNGETDPLLALTKELDVKTYENIPYLENVTIGAKLAYAKKGTKQTKKPNFLK